MVRLILFFAFIIFSLPLNGQDKIISGSVTDTSGTALIGVEVTTDGYSKFNSNYSYSNIDGLWVIKVDAEKTSHLTFKYNGYLPISIKIDTLYPMSVLLEPIPALDNDDHYPKPYNPEHKGTGIFQFGFDFNRGNYDGFRPLLGDIITDFLDNEKAMVFVGFGYEWINWLMGFNIGGFPSYGDNELPQNVSSDNFMIDLYTGFKIMDTRRFKLTSKIGFKYLNFNMRSTFLEDDAELADYLNNPDLDLTFGQPLGYLGLDLEIKFPTNDALMLNYWTIGIYTNYLFKIKDTPYLGTRNVGLSSNIPIDFRRSNWGIAGRMYFGSQR